MPLKTPPARLQPLETTAAILLTLAAGYVDAVGFLKLDGIYVANMSGNSVAVGIHLSQADWPTVLERLLPIACYVAGLFAARLLVDLAEVLHFRRFVAASLLVEILFLFLFIQSNALNSGIILATLAMGIQAATVTRFNGVTVHTAFITGSLIRIAETVSEWLIASLRRNREKSAQARRDSLWFLSVWLAYIAGAVVGAWLFTRIGPSVLIAVCVLLAGLSIPLFLHPRELDPRT
jgi:uncharacterized membrane protein YoaK (UPF0700 family)